jgi:hypothetical protein
MAYQYEVLHRIDQRGITVFNIKLVDPEGIYEELLIPVVLEISENIEEDILNLINKIIQQEITRQDNIKNQTIQEITQVNETLYSDLTEINNDITITE